MKYAIIAKDYFIIAAGETAGDALGDFDAGYDCYENEHPTNTTYETAEAGDYVLLPCADDVYADYLEFGRDVMIEVKHGVVVAG